MLGLGSLRLAKGARMQPQSQASNDGGGRPDWKRELINEKPTFSFFGDEWPAAGFRTHASHDPRSSRRAEEGASRPLSQCNCSRTPRRPYGPRPGHSRAWLWQPQGTIATSPFAAASSEKLRWPWPPKISFLLLGLNFRILDGSARWIDVVVDADQYAAGGIWPEKLFFFRDVHRDLVLSFRAPISRRPIMCKSSKVGGQL